MLIWNVMPKWDWSKIYIEWISSRCLPFFARTAHLLVIAMLLSRNSIPKAVLHERQFHLITSMIRWTNPKLFVILFANSGCSFSTFSRTSLYTSHKRTSKPTEILHSHPFFFFYLLLILSKSILHNPKEIDTFSSFLPKDWPIMFEQDSNNRIYIEYQMHRRWMNHHNEEDSYP